MFFFLSRGEKLKPKSTCTINSYLLSESAVDRKLFAGNQSDDSEFGSAPID